MGKNFAYVTSLRLVVDLPLCGIDHGKLSSASTEYAGCHTTRDLLYFGNVVGDNRAAFKFLLSFFLFC